MGVLSHFSYVCPLCLVVLVVCSRYIAGKELPRVCFKQHAPFLWKLEKCLILSELYFETAAC